MSVMDYNNYGAYTGYQAAYPSYTGYSSQPNHFNLKVGRTSLLFPQILSSEPPIKSRQSGNKTKKLLNFLPAWQPAGLIRTLSGIIKSLLSSQVDIWVLVAPPLPSLPPHQDEYRQKFTNLTKFGSKRANFGLVPSTNHSRAGREKVSDSQ